LLSTFGALTGDKVSEIPPVVFGLSGKEAAMFRTTLISIILFSLLAGTPVLAAQQDYTEQLIKLTQLSDNEQYREAIDGYKSLQAQPGTPGWLKAACEYEIAELYGALDETDNAIAALGRAAQLGFDDCLTPRASKRLATILKNPKARQALAGMKIAEADFRELIWLKSEVEHAEYDARMMITDNINRVDQQATEIPQAQLPTRPTASAGVLYWRQQLLLIQRAQREFVKRSDEERMVHAATMGVIGGVPSPSAVLESARKARATAESRKEEIRKRAFVPVATSSDQPKPCSEWAVSSR
jgi:tetratricopeptide (TPR) repeat protein